MATIKVRREDLPMIASKSLRNCHCVGLDSVMFDDTPEARLRTFIADPSHEMYKNAPKMLLSIALHSHHCDVKLTPIVGEVWNMSIMPGVEYDDYAAYKYQSQITTGTGSFVRHDKDADLRGELIGHELKRPYQMPASEIHSVYVPRGKFAAWFVNEGKEDPNYNGLAFSNHDLEKCDFSNLYQPMSVEYLTGLLGKIGAKIC